jgi:hypothetical protein
MRQLFAFAMCIAAMIDVAHAGSQKLTASDGAAQDCFGRSVNISGDYAVIGSYLDDDVGADSGSAYIFKHTTSPIEHWYQQAKLTAFDGAAQDYFGFSVALTGDHAIVGAFRDDDNGYDSGSAYVFRRDGTTWSLHQKLTADDAQTGDSFGLSVAIAGDYAIVGAYGDDDTGSAYIFRRTMSTDIWLQEAKLTASDAAPNDSFGHAVAISGDVAVVGAYLDDDLGGSSGSVHVFERDGTTWSEVAKLTADDGASNDLFGCSVAVEASAIATGDGLGDGPALSFDCLVVGATGDDDNGEHSGSAYVFHRNLPQQDWYQSAKLVPGDGRPRYEFGQSVSISGDAIIVGSGDDDTLIDSGAVYAFRCDGAQWAAVGKLTEGDGLDMDLFGKSLGISGDLLLVGAAYDDDKGENAGAAYTYELDEIDWALFCSGFESGDTTEWSATVP